MRMQKAVSACLFPFRTMKTMFYFCSTFATTGEICKPNPWKPYDPDLWMRIRPWMEVFQDVAFRPLNMCFVSSAPFKRWFLYSLLKKHSCRVNVLPFQVVMGTVWSVYNRDFPQLSETTKLPMFKDKLKKFMLLTVWLLYPHAWRKSRYLNGHSCFNWVAFNLCSVEFYRWVCLSITFLNY
jgi:hypothetical protein